jgi:hypothetical protein
VNSTLKRIYALGALVMVMGVFLHAQPGDVSNSSTAPGTTSHKTAVKNVHKNGIRRKAHKRASRGQQKIDPQRAQQIQEALAREHYLSGKPSGVWDNTTQVAMQKYQADNGWQTKTTPDSRALIKLGLGPDHEHLLNPESAMTSEPQARTVPAASSGPSENRATQPHK